MKRLNLCMVGVVALALAAAPVAFAQGTTTNATGTTTSTDMNMNSQTVTGTVVSTSGDQVVITTDAGQRMTFDKGAGFTLPSNVSVGDRVTVTYNTPSAGKYTVNEIVMATTPSTTSTYNQRTPATSTTENMGTTRTGHMPRTASPLPLVALLGLLSLGAGAGLRVLNARRAR